MAPLLLVGTLSHEVGTRSCMTNRLSHLIEPTRMHREMHQDGVGIRLAHPLRRGFAPVRRAVVHYPEHSICRTVDRLLHHLLDQSPERLDARLGLAKTHDQSLPDAPGGQVLQRPTTLVFRLDSPPPTRGRPEGLVTANASLDTGLLVRADDPV